MSCRYGARLPPDIEEPKPSKTASDSDDESAPIGVLVFQTSPPPPPVPTIPPAEQELKVRLERAGAKGGDIQISLGWNNYNDIDLHVREPSGEVIYFSQRRSRSGGELDVDANAGGGATLEPVENIYWPRRGAPAGRYAVFVHYFARYDAQDATSYGVSIQYGGKRVYKSGVIRSQSVEAPVEIFSFQYPPR